LELVTYFMENVIYSHNFILWILIRVVILVSWFLVKIIMYFKFLIYFLLNIYLISFFFILCNVEFINQKVI
jgi:hypothetical protein